ncbi:GFA family protein [Phytopseudomonas dryadis]|uniref:Aldehyde-activating protein n=1 Tax=Phytopseudomonas dryadis TaxID=2487520 RepID=A0A4Q9QWG6_9GAMM|nr:MULTISPECIES: GFA family protein [Pseudomonas]TBU88305.1 aldehyde-activating protein [Pseudomonas dryadis]TBV05488.1 aldehyde-activating protein [Pseudomonas dryadis]TBV18497.1 aldehyde-activating protein [Pseudomonas sp. FRB 230]
MNATQEKHGRCLCGAVGISISTAQLTVSACHCATCRKWGGGPLMVVESETPPRISGEQQVRVHASSDWAERGFCGQCGSHLFYRLKAGGFHAIPVGLLDGDEAWRFELQVFIDAKPAYYCFANQTRNLTGEELFAQHGQA